MKSFPLAATMIIAVILVSGCAQYGGNQTSQPPPSENSVAIQSFAFNPSTITVKAGTTITWTNKDSAPHTITSDSGVFDSGQIQNGGTFSYTFNTPGTYTYHCAVHPNMKATVVVTQ